MNQLRILTLVVFCFFSFGINGQKWHVTWEKQPGNSKMDYFTDVISDINGGFAVLGSTIT